MLIPIEIETAEDFIVRARDVLARDDTHVYVDTSLVMWLTALGPTSRSSFIEWAETLGERVHVPAWTMQEYYRHYRDRTQTLGIADKCLAVEQAIEELARHMRVYADGPLSPGRAEMAFVKELDDARQGMLRALKVARGWDHEVPSAEVISWMNRRVLAGTRVFDGFAELKRRGAQRYSHEVPPGFEDGHKGQNRFGDLLFWEDVVSDAAERQAKAVVILTRDRKKDWFYSRIEARVSTDLKQLAGKWNPVPIPHPMLSLELKTAAKADLLLVDELYLGGLMWSTDKERFGRLAAVTFGRDLDWLTERLAPPPSVMVRAGKRAASDTIGFLKANAIIAAAKGGPTDAVNAILATLVGAAPAVEGVIESFTPGMIVTLGVEGAAALSRQLYDRALNGPTAEGALARRLLDIVDAVDAEHASAIVGGMLVGAYFTGAGTRERPVGDLLQDVFAWRGDPGVKRLLDLLAGVLAKARSPALWYPSASDEPLPVRIDAAASVVTTPVSVGRIFVGPQSVLVNNALEPAAELAAQLGGAQIATALELAQATARYYGIPLDLIRLADAEPDESRTILAGTGFDRFDQAKQPARPLKSGVGTGASVIQTDGTGRAAEVPVAAVEPSAPARASPADANGPAGGIPPPGTQDAAMEANDEHDAEDDEDYDDEDDQ